MEKIIFNKKRYNAFLLLLLVISYLVVFYFFSNFLSWRDIFISFLVIIPIWLFYIKSFNKIKSSEVYFTKDGLIFVRLDSDDLHLSWDMLIVDLKAKKYSGIFFSRAIELRSLSDPDFIEVLNLDIFEGDSVVYLIKKYVPKNHNLSLLIESRLH